MAVFISAARSQYYYQPFPVTRSERSNPEPYKPEPYPSYPPAVYNFDWNVLDTYSQNDYGHKVGKIY